VACLWSATLCSERTTPRRGRAGAAVLCVRAVAVTKPTRSRCLLVGGPAGALREELEFITRELSRAMGLGGRSRKAGSIAERARLNVSRAVKAAIQRVASADAELGAHLKATVHTGVVCVYTPDPRVPIGWKVSHRDR
jgi:hypothetical protein